LYVGKCEAGFMRVNEFTPCGELMLYSHCHAVVSYCVSFHFIYLQTT